MDPDPIVEEVRRTRQDYARSFGNDLRALAAHLKKEEEKHPDRLVSLPPKSPRRKQSA